MNKETIDEVVTYLIPLHNNLAARIHVLYKITSEDINKVTRFTKKQVFSIRIDAKKKKKDIEPDMYKKIIDICDYFESMFVMAEISK